jgi:hypothetical protein
VAQSDCNAPRRFEEQLGLAGELRTLLEAKQQPQHPAHHHRLALLVAILSASGSGQLLESNSRSSILSP